MFSKMKRGLVESYVGAIGLGWMLAQIVAHLVNVFATPMANWISRREYASFGIHPSPPLGFRFQDGLPELIRFIFYLLIWYVLMRWLYLTPNSKPATVAEANPE
jgi:hypothetical protein